MSLFLDLRGNLQEILLEQGRFAMRYFDFEKLACEAGISADKMRELCQIIRREFPGDDMMYELHILRACMAIRDGNVSLEDVIHTEPEVQLDKTRI